MPLNSHPLRPVTEVDREDYRRDGVVCLRNVFDQDWIASLLPYARRMFVDNEDFGLLPTIPNRYMTRKIEAFRRFIFDSPLGEACGRVLGSKQVRFFFDEIFAKPPKSDKATIWHCDRAGWPVEGMMVPSLWIPLTPITKENSLECIAGSFRQDVKYWLFSPNAQKMVRPPDRLPHPDGEALRGNPDVRFLSWQMEPGDMLVVHPWELHYSSGNPAPDWRFALSVRVFGDDIAWQPRPDCVNVPGICWDEMIPGVKPAGKLFPLIWSEDGARESARDYPTEFAATWPRGIEVAQQEHFSFADKLKKVGGGSRLSVEGLASKTN